MSRAKLGVAAACALLAAHATGCASASAASAGSSVASVQAGAVLPAGKWTGWVKPEKEPVRFVTYDVTVTAMGLGIQINTPGRQSFTFQDVKLSNGILTFIWPLEQCTLTRQDDGRFEGDCALPDGSDRARLAMIPPGK